MPLHGMFAQVFQGRLLPDSGVIDSGDLEVFAVWRPHPRLGRTGHGDGNPKAHPSHIQAPVVLGSGRSLEFCGHLALLRGLEFWETARALEKPHLRIPPRQQIRSEGLAALWSQPTGLQGSSLNI